LLKMINPAYKLPDSVPETRLTDKKFAEIRVICDSFLYIPKLFA